MLKAVSVKSDSRQVSAGDYRSYVRQEPNARWLGLLRAPMGLYCMSGTDSTSTFNRFMHRIGEAPVVYDTLLTRYSREAMASALRSKGYLRATVTAEAKTRHRRTRLTYRLHPGRRYYIRDFDLECDNDTILQFVNERVSSPFYNGMSFDLSVIEDYRSRIVKQFRSNGYYNVGPEFVTFRADTLSGELGIHLSTCIVPPASVPPEMAYRQYRIGDVTIHEAMSHLEDGPVPPSDTTTYRGVRIIHPGHGHLRGTVYRREVFQRPGQLFDERRTPLTYQGLNALPIVNYATVSYSDPHPGDSLLDVDVYAHLNRLNGISFDLEGTNTAGDFGGAASLTYTNRNLFRASESLSLKLRGAYEAIRHLEGYGNQNYIEYGAEATLRFPFIPLISRLERASLFKGNSEFSIVYNSQDRPEFHRRLLTASWSVNWHNRSQPCLRHRIDLLSVNYVFMPWISDNFREQYLQGDDPRYAVLRYSYEDLFIVKAGYSFVYNSLSGNSTTANLNNTNGYQIKCGIETAGNLLYAVCALANTGQEEDGRYSLFNIPFSQYAKFDFDFAKSWVIDQRQSLAFHFGFGIGLPYGNSTILPYEKRYFSGGANSVRGWSVRQLGPGSFVGQDGKVDFVRQTGNLKLDLSLEYRSYLFWKLHSAVFIDAGNIWNTRDYADQPGGTFAWDTFYNQIAVSYGIGLRLNFDFFILRLDGGMKAINPACPSGPDHWPIIHPRFSRDFALHFAVGLPF